MSSTRLIYVLRHAKSSWKSGLPDHERPLAGRGRRAAKAIRAHLLAEGIEPELVLCSTARRARETLERIEPALGAASVQIERELYGASSGALLDRLRALPGDVGSVLLIGHNPGLQMLALDLAPPSAERRELDAKFPTAALATLAFAGPDWQALEPGAAELVAFVRPRDLER
jgi:phosphohistidine phosphatase